MGRLLEGFGVGIISYTAKMGMTEEIELSLQVLRGFETDISLEVNEIKEITMKVLEINKQDAGGMKQSSVV